jgi:hypothetical protein
MKKNSDKILNTEHLGLASGWRVKSGLKYSKYSVYGNSLAESSSIRFWLKISKRNFLTTN